MKITIIVARELKHKSIYSVWKTIPLGACYIGTVLKEKGHEVEILDEFLTKVIPEKIDSDIILISSLTNCVTRAYELSDIFRKLGKKVILGGPHVSLMPDEAVKHADHIVIGEGESVINELVEKGGKKVVKADHSINLDTLPFPDFGIVKNLKNPPTILLSTSRGCPFDCKFCAVVKMHGRKYRARSAENVIKELKQRAPIKKVLFFNDDNFIANRQRAIDIIKGIRDNDILHKNASWGTQLRVEVANDKEMLKLMSDSKCFRLYIGLESINPATLKEYKKYQSVKDVRNCVKTLHDYGIGIFAMFVIGSDHDTKQTVRETADFCCDTDVDIMQFASYTPLPGTRLYDELKKKQRIITYDWQYFDLQHVVHKPKLMTPYELQVELFDAFRKVYSPKRVMHYLFSSNPYVGVINAYFAYQTRAWEKKKNDYLEFLEKVS